MKALISFVFIQALLFWSFIESFSTLRVFGKVLIFLIWIIPFVFLRFKEDYRFLKNTLRLLFFSFSGRLSFLSFSAIPLESDHFQENTIFIRVGERYNFLEFSEKSVEQESIRWRFHFLKWRVTLKFCRFTEKL